MKMDASSLLPSSSLPSADVYTDLNSLQNIKNTENKDEALKKVAQQFESIFVNQMLKSMREANAVFEEDSLFNSQESNFYRDMHDQQLALTLSHGRGMGVADALYRQLSGQKYGNTEPVNTSVASYQASPVHAVPKYYSSDNISAAAPKGERSAMATSPDDFIQQMLPNVTKAAEKLGVEPEVLIAQAALETGWGEKVIADKNGQPSNNLFNIKAHNGWQGNAVTAETLEFANGKFEKEKAAFRQYGSIEESVNDYVSFIQGNPRYQDIATGTKTAEEYIQGITQAGYATDPAYANKVLSVLERVADKVKALSGNTSDNG
ncbi:flagellar assembly peptidoglycan hydrolase FlgJ [Saccharophagus degradans]|uniref:Peptidoglycan hydrolase FlgJ n=1 Tax=Saccharophagus degradans TaxID=86304 RepID=A0AAW7X0Y3_9GAMM|nr:flagellar assembly peptidoglycan hydrolase FlgJ [Saccharophagus degradans]MDO6420984.1 flagellar assembly peptidoglycan hydrolase FlgJ [Saccharophagus degradans]MDO6606105.1 flagellar assembly peptidoglycan hydrolase FlgJ [Saccharophagus degradans]